MANSADIIGWAFDAALYCPAHKPAPTKEELASAGQDEVNPVFLDDAEERDCCDVCFCRLLGD